MRFLQCVDLIVHGLSVCAMLSEVSWGFISFRISTLKRSFGSKLSFPYNALAMSKSQFCKSAYAVCFSQQRGIDKMWIICIFESNCGWQRTCGELGDNRIKRIDWRGDGKIDDIMWEKYFFLSADNLFLNLKER
jgi:hypothetical protein